MLVIKQIKDLDLILNNIQSTIDDIENNIPSLLKQVFIADGVEDSFTVDGTLNIVNYISINGLVQSPLNYSVSGDTVIFADIPPNNDLILISYFSDVTSLIAIESSSGLSGTPNTIPKYTSTGDNLVSSNLTDNGTNFIISNQFVTLTEQLSVGNKDNDTYMVVDNTGVIRGVSKYKTPVVQNITGATTIDLSQGDIFILILTANVTNFNYTNEIIGKQYIFVFVKETSNKTLTWQSGKYFFPFGNAPVLTNPTTNGSVPARSEDIVTALCISSGRLHVVLTPDLLPN
jgi:hypothetical protein